MITIEKNLELPDTYPLDRIGEPSRLLFFDIETTGFSGDLAQLYLIGCTWHGMDGWRLIQWFADTAKAEEELLHAFFSFMTGFQILVHFNGDSFDIPFLLKRCAYYGLEYGFSEIESFDIYKKIKPLRKPLGIGSLKQKTIEQFLGVQREDLYNGGQLIRVYLDYLHTRSQHSCDLLLLHNEDDLKGMSEILPILSYPDFFQSPFQYVCQKILSEASPSGAAHPFLSLTCQSSQVAVPIPIAWEGRPVSWSAAGSRLQFTIELLEGTLKHFYKNYKDYYYLVYEDTAVHKSIGEFVDKEARIRATSKNCYTKQDGCFLPQFSPVFAPVMQKEPKDKLTYAPLNQVHFETPALFQEYLAALLAHLNLRP